MKFFTSIFLIVVSLFSFSNLVLAQSTNGTTIATININDALITKQDDRDFMLSFKISNKNGAQSQVRYSVKLLKMVSSGEIVIDEKIYDETLSIGANTDIEKNIRYSAPEFLPPGDYNLELESRNSSGLILGIALFGTVTLKGDMSNTVYIIPESCQFVDAEEKVLSSSAQNIAIYPEDSLYLLCMVQSDIENPIVFEPSFITKKNSSFGEEVQVSQLNVGTTTIIRGLNKTIFTLPLSVIPGNYNLLIMFSSENKKIITNKITVNYLVLGDTGNIQNLVFNRTYYQKGDDALLQIYSTQSKDGEIKILLKNDKGECSLPLIKNTKQFSILNISVPIIKNCNNPVANVELYVDGKIVDSKSFSIISTNSDMAGKLSFVEKK